MNRQFLWTYFIGVPILALSSFFILFLLLKDNKNNIYNVTKLPLNNSTKTTKIYSTTKYFNTPLITKFSNQSKTTVKISKISSTKNYNTIAKSTTTITPCLSGRVIKKCENELILSLDSSSDILTPQLFQNQINAIKNNVINYWYNFTKISLTWYNELAYTSSTFGTIETEDEFKYFLTLIHQNKGSNLSSLIKQLNKINVDNFKNISTIVFVSKIEESDILNVLNDALILKNKGSLSFIVLENIPNISFLKLLNPNEILTWNFSLDTASKLSKFINSIRKCKDFCKNYISTYTSNLITKIFSTTKPIITSTNISKISTSNIKTSTKIKSTSTLNLITSTTRWRISPTNNITFTTTSSLVTTTQFQCPFGKPIQICDGNIVMVIDSTNDTLTPNLFERQLEVIKNNIEPLWNDYSKIALGWYNKFPTIDFSYGTINNKEEFDKILYSIQQYRGSSLSKLLSSINNLPEQKKKITIFVFISEISNNELMKSIPYVSLLKKKGNVNFIILGNVVPIHILETLKPTAVYSWDFTCTNAIQIVKFVNASMSCTTECSNESLSYLKNVVKNDSSYLNLKKNKNLKKSYYVKNKCLNGILVKNCSNDILFILDASNDLISKSEFIKMVSAVKDHFISLFYDYSRIALSWYNSNSLTYFPFSTIKRKFDFDHDISLIKQQPGRNLRSHLKDIIYKYLQNYGNNNKNISIFLYISNISKIDLLQSIGYINDLKNFGSVNIIAMGKHINMNDLKLLNGSKIFMWDFSWKSTFSMISFFNDIAQCRFVCQESIKKDNLKFKVNTYTTTSLKPNISKFYLNEKNNCSSDIYFIIDSTNDVLNKESFNMQISLLQDNISTFIDNYNTVSLSWYDYNPHLLFPISKISSKQNFIKNLQKINQKSGSRLSKILKVISSMALINDRKISVYIFVSKNSTTEFDKSIEYIKTMKKYGNVNFICLGYQVQKLDLAQLLPSNVFEWNFNKSLTESLINFYINSKTCDTEYIYSSTISPITETITSPDIQRNTKNILSTTISSLCINETPLTICDKNIVIALVTSKNSLLLEVFKTKINTIINNIYSNRINLKNVTLSRYNKGIKVKAFEIFSSENYFDELLKNITKFDDWKMNELFNLLNLIPTSENISTFIFVSEDRFNEILGCDEYFSRLKNKGSLNFILINFKIEKKYLKLLNNTNIFQWNMKNESISKIGEFFKKSLNCINVCESSTVSLTDNYTTSIFKSTKSKSILTSTSLSVETSTTQKNIMTSIYPNLITIKNSNITSTTLSSEINMSSTMLNISNASTFEMSSKKFSTTSISMTMIPFTKCGTNVFFVLDGRGEVSSSLFEKQKKILVDIAQKLNMIHNNATININYIDNMFNILFPIQPKSFSTIISTPEEWKCALSFISENKEMYKKSCNKSLLVPFQKLSTSSGPTIDKVLQKFQKEISYSKKTHYNTTFNQNSIMILFTLTKEQKEIDDSLDYVNDIKLNYKQFHLAVVKLSYNDTFNYSKISKNVLEFSYLDIFNFVKNFNCD
ncbi:von Willebrand factor, type A domain-containing protein [Strongyloides ratti]|uniref:von Willebrand factor, type A domain-containing protein n=1 Tax=Strongyloides ratti TaxID=34506 RepID=A0A090L1J0_STRRB|nr:von Willebrand factor, type A domain-containing protein [Strongyloides ratti]CEF61339.1 von Willebrand factor, type A domain-containing protein [Strongyloides ratti]